jgi:hypothetical protein
LEGSTSTEAGASWAVQHLTCRPEEKPRAATNTNLTLLDILSYFVDFYRCVGCVIFIFTGAAAFEAGSAGSNTTTTTTTTPTYQVVQNH